MFETSFLLWPSSLIYRAGVSTRQVKTKLANRTWFCISYQTQKVPSRTWMLDLRALADVNYFWLTPLFFDKRYSRS
jgi:hypothetical protein